MSSKLISIRDVMLLTGIQSRNTLHNKVQMDEFPRPVRIGKRAVRFRESEVLAWIDDLPASLIKERWYDTERS